MPQLPHVATLSLLLYRGEDYVASGVHKVSGAFGAPEVDISGYTIKATLKESITDTDAVLEVDCALGCVIDNIVVPPTKGGYHIPITSVQSKALDERDYVIDVWRVDDGAKTVMAKGTLSARQPVRTP